MGFIDTLLALRQRTIWARFRGFLTAPVPAASSVEEAYRRGLQTGYSEGLMDGVDLGLEVGLSKEPLPPEEGRSTVLSWVKA